MKRIKKEKCHVDIYSHGNDLEIIFFTINMFWTTYIWRIQGQFLCESVMKPYQLKYMKMKERKETVMFLLELDTCPHFFSIYVCKSLEENMTVRWIEYIQITLTDIERKLAELSL